MGTVGGGDSGIDAKARDLFESRGGIDPYAELKYKMYKNELEELHNQLERMDTDYTELEERYFKNIEAKTVEIEAVDPRDIQLQEADIEF